VGTTSATKTVTIESVGTTPLAIGEVELQRGQGGEFSVDASQCANQSIAPGASCVISVSLQPSSPGPARAKLAVRSNSPNSPTSVSLSGAGGVPVLGVTPTTLSFGAVQPGTTKAMKVKAESVGNEAISFTGLTIGGAAGGGTFAQGKAECLEKGTLAPGETCEVEVLFTPSGLSTFEGELTFQTSAVNSPVTSLAGTGRNLPSIAVDPSAWSFGGVKVGGSSQPRAFVVKNSGFDLLTIGSITLGGADAGAFRVAADGCGKTSLAPGATCEVSVVAEPGRIGALAAALAIPSDASNASELTVPLSVEGKADAAIAIEPAEGDFGSQQVGAATTRAFAVKSVGNTPLTIDRARLAGPGAAGFELKGDGCAGKVLARGETCQVEVDFKPGAPGVVRASLGIASDATTGTGEVELIGDGLAPPEPEPGP
jgi:hypothetical protein